MDSQASPVLEDICPVCGLPQRAKHKHPTGWVSPILAAGYTCTACGMFVPAGSSHFHSGEDGAIYTVLYPEDHPSFDEQVLERLDRIEKMLQELARKP